MVEATHTQSGYRGWIFANPLVGWVALIMIIVEWLFVLCWGTSFRSTDLPTRFFGLAFIAWFWVTTGWLLFGAAQIWKRAKSLGGFMQWALRIALSISGIGLILVYASSWGLFFKSGRLANLEALQFVAFNLEFLWDYLSQAEPIHLITLAAILAVTSVIVPFMLHYGSSSKWMPKDKKPVVAWMFLTFATYLVWSWIPVEQSVLRRANRRRALELEMHPSFTMLVSFADSKWQSKIEPSLDERSLVPINDQVTTIHEPENRYSVIVVAIESLRHDMVHLNHQNQEVLPHINRLARKGIEFTRAYAQSTHSDYADICLVSSLYPLRTRHHHYYDRSDPWPKVLAYDVLKKSGYATAIISSQNEKWGGMSEFLDSPHLDRFYHPETASADAAFTKTSTMDPGFARERSLGTLTAGKLPDQHTTTKAIEWIEEQVGSNTPFFLSMNLQSSHFPYLISKDAKRPFQPCDLDASISFVRYAKADVPKVKNAYFNAIHECDRQVGRLVDALRRSGQLEKTILIVTGENGEAFHECGGSVTHAREPVEPAIHVACVMHCPDLLAAQVEPYPMEHVDLMPTLFGLLGIGEHPNFQGIDVFSENRRAASQRLTFCHVNSSLAQCDAVMLGGRWKLTVDRFARVASLFDTKDDPNEEHDLIELKPNMADRLHTRLDEWRSRQLAYYHFPHYYMRYYPPAPPVWTTRDEPLDSVKVSEQESHMKYRRKSQKTESEQVESRASGATPHDRKPLVIR